MSYFDGLKLIDSYINIWGSDLKDYYENEEQLSIMYARLKQYISHVN